MKHPTRSPTRSHRKAKPAPPGNAWLLHHFYVLLSSLGHIVRTPLPSLMIAAVIGIALALPAGLYLLLENVQHVSSNWSGGAQISLYLNKDISNAQVQKLSNQLKQYSEISNVKLITPEQALKEYLDFSGFGDALKALKENPLPTVLIIQPTTSFAKVNERLLKNLEQLPEVDIAQFDMLWLKRLFAIMKVVQRGVLILASLLSLAVILVIGNTIRLAIDKRREEIEIYKLVGATNIFIRRPFLYTGFWYGLLGGLIAWLLVNISFWLLQAPVQHLTALYYSQFQLIFLDTLSSLVLLLSGALLGLAGAWLAVGQHLKDIQPR